MCLHERSDLATDRLLFLRVWIVFCLDLLAFFGRHGSGCRLQCAYCHDDCSNERWHFEVRIMVAILHKSRSTGQSWNVGCAERPVHARLLEAHMYSTIRTLHISRPQSREGFEFVHRCEPCAEEGDRSVSPGTCNINDKAAWEETCLAGILRSCLYSATTMIYAYDTIKVVSLRCKTVTLLRGYITCKKLHRCTHQLLKPLTALPHDRNDGTRLSHHSRSQRRPD